MIEAITAYEFTYIPFDRYYPVKSCVITIYARDRKEAEGIALLNYKFFDQDCTCSVREIMGGYRRVMEKTND